MSNSVYYAVDVLVGEGMVTYTDEDFVALIQQIEALIDTHGEDASILRATGYFNKGESTDIKLKVINTLQQRRS